MAEGGMASHLQINHIDALLAPVLKRHPGFHLEQSSQVNSVWSGRIRRERSLREVRMDDVEMALRDALHSSHLEVRSTTVCRDCIDLQVTAPEPN